MSHALYRTYRPATFADVAGQEHVKQVLQNQLKRDEVAHAYLFCGPRGVGKTTVARLLAKAVNCEAGRQHGEPCGSCRVCVAVQKGSAMDLFEIDAASHTGVDHVREHILENVPFAPVEWKRKVFILDEAHMLSVSAFNALLKTLEEPPSHVLFILATTEVEKLPPTVVSRCQRFDFRRLAPREIEERLARLSEREGVAVDPKIFSVIARHTDGCLRDAETLLGQLMAAGQQGKPIGYEDVAFLLPMTHTEAAVRYVESCLGGDAKAALDAAEEVFRGGADMGDFEEEVMRAIETGLTLQAGVEDPFCFFSDGNKEQLRGAVARHGSDAARQILEWLLEYRRLSRGESLPMLPLLLTAVRATSLESDVAGPASLDKENPERVSPIVPATTVGRRVEGQEETSTGGTSLETMRARWDACCDAAREKSSSLLLLLKNAVLTGVENGEMILQVSTRFLADEMRQERHQKIFGEISKDIFGSVWRLKPVYQPAEEDVTVARVLKSFGGSVLPEA